MVAFDERIVNKKESKLSVQTGIMRLKADKNLQAKYKGKIGVLCHSASIDESYNHTLDTMIETFGKQVTKVFGPQHGFVTDVQDNMIETDHATHPVYKLPIYSLYSETRKPTDQMLEGLDHIFIDLQDVGTRIYTYIYTMTYMLEACADKDIEVIILDRPNPINGIDIEGNILDLEFKSFVGRHPLPVRHAMTMAEVAKMHQENWADKKCKLSVIEMSGWERSMTFWDTKLPYVNPSPNLPTIEGLFTFVGSVLLEGTNISEGRGTTRPLEILGHPKFDPYKHLDHFNNLFKELGLHGFILRVINFHPMFQKHAGETCNGYHIHVTNYKEFKPWRVFQVLTKEMIHILGDHFTYKQEPYEYGDGLNPMDMINGTDEFRAWYETSGNYQFLDEIEAKKTGDFLASRESILLY